MSSPAVYSFYTEKAKWLELLELQPVDEAAFVASQHPSFGEGQRFAMPYDSARCRHVRRPKKYLNWAKKKMASMSPTEIWEEIDYNIRSVTWGIRTILKLHTKNLSVWAAGGDVNHLLDPIAFEKRAKKAGRYNICYDTPKDVDLYIVGEGTAEERIAVLKAIVSMIGPSNCRPAYYTRNQYAVSATLFEPGREVIGVRLVNIVTTKASTINDILKWFDIDCSAIALSANEYNEPTVVAEPRCIKALRTRMNVHREHLITNSYATRLGKYMTRGYDYLVPSTYDVREALSSKEHSRTSMLSVISHGAETWGSEIADFVYSDQSDTFMLTASCGAASDQYIHGREKAIRPSAMSQRLDVVILGGYLVQGGPMEQPRMSTLPPLDFSLTPEAMQKENAEKESVKKDDWPTLKK
jgi:hypothetical protein